MISLISAITLIPLGIILKFYPPKEINSIYGYRTKTSVKNQKVWDIAQKYCAYSFIILGILNLTIGLWSMITPSNFNGYNMQILFLVITSILSILTDEMMLKQVKQ